MLLFKQNEIIRRMQSFELVKRAVSIKHKIKQTFVKEEKNYKI